MATKETTHQQTHNVQDLVERLIYALDERKRAGSTDGRITAETRSLSPQATAAIASFNKTVSELAVLPSK
jgi:hypothetical protein